MATRLTCHVLLANAAGGTLSLQVHLDLYGIVRAAVWLTITHKWKLHGLPYQRPMHMRMHCSWMCTCYSLTPAGPINHLDAAMLLCPEVQGVGVLRKEQSEHHRTGLMLSAELQDSPQSLSVWPSE